MTNVIFMPPEHQDLKLTKELVRGAIGPLLEVFPDETLCVVHHSFTEFLKDMGEGRIPRRFLSLEACAHTSSTRTGMLEVSYLRVSR